MADLILTDAMTQCLAETAGSSQQAQGRAAFNAASQTDVGDNTSDIATNTADIATNQTNIATNASDITALQNDIAARLIDWRGIWTPGTTAEANQMFREDALLAIANKQTTDAPLPQASADPTTDLPDAPAWAQGSHTGLVHAWHTYTFSQSGWVEFIQIWPSAVGPTIAHEVFAVDETDPANPRFLDIPVSPNITAGQWNTVALPSSIFYAGSVVSIHYLALDSSSDSTFNFTWDYAGTEPNAQPASGAWNNRSQQDIVRVHNDDSTATDRSASLATVIPGSTLRCADTLDATKYYEYQINTSTALASSYEFGVVLVATGPGGPPTATAESTLTFTVPVPASTLYESEAGYWTSGEPDWASVEGGLELGGTPSGAAADAYGVRIQVQPAYVSPDWDLLATLSTSDIAQTSAGIAASVVDGPAYGGIIATDNATAEAAATTTPSKITACWTANSPASNATPDEANGKITALVDGDYQFTFGISFEDGSNEEFTFELYIDAAGSGFKCARKLGTGGDIGSTGMSGIISLTAGEEVSIYHSIGAGTSAITAEQAQLTIKKID